MGSSRSTRAWCSKMPDAALRELLAAAQIEPTDWPLIAGADPVLPTPYRLGAGGALGPGVAAVGGPARPPAATRRGGSARRGAVAAQRALSADQWRAAAAGMG